MPPSNIAPHTNPFAHPDDVRADEQIQTLTGSSSKAVEAEKSKEAEPPPRYDEIYQGDGKYFTKEGKNRLMNSPTHRNEFIHKERINTKFIHSEEVGFIYDKTPIFIVDDSGSMKNKLSKGASNFKSLMKKTFTPKETALKEQEKTVLKLMGDLESYCSQIPSMFNLSGGYLNKASSVGVDTKEFLSKVRGATPLASTLDKVKEQLKASSDKNDVSIYLFTDGDPTEGFTIADCRLNFENKLRDLIDNGINVIKKDSIVHNRKVGVAMQYIGDDDAPFEYNFSQVEAEVKNYLRQNIKTGGPVVGSDDIEKLIYEKMMNQIRGGGSSGAYYSALDNQKMGGIKRFDVNDDKHSEINDARKHGHNITSKEVSLKMMVGMWVPRLDGKDEGDLKLEKQVSVLLDSLNDFAHQLVKGR